MCIRKYFHEMFVEFFGRLFPLIHQQNPQQEGRVKDLAALHFGWRTIAINKLELIYEGGMGALQLGESLEDAGWRTKGEE